VALPADGTTTTPAPSGASTPAPAFVSAPATQIFGTLPALTQPVDSTVPASQLNPNAQAGGVSIPAAFDLNSLPATGAGPSDLLGFTIARVPQDEVGFRVRSGIRVEPEIEGQRLFLYHGIPTLQLGGEDSVRVPEDAFAHTDPAAIVHLDAHLINGSPLPSWLQFDGLRGSFHGVPPEGLAGSLEIEVVARDTAGREARTSFVLLVEDLRAERQAHAGHDIPDLMLGLDVDAKEAERARLKAEAEKARLEAAKQALKPLKAPAASFSDQVRAAKPARDPLLDRIAGRNPDGTGTRR
jgi:hypothetical protein